MAISIRKVFFNFKMTLLGVGVGVLLLNIELFHIAQYGDRLSALKNQHLLIDKITNTDLSDPAMASILIKGAIAEMALSVKLSGEEALLDRYITSNDEQASLLRSLTLSSKAFEESAAAWSASLGNARDGHYERMMNARTAYLADIDRMMDYQTHIINESLSTIKMTAVIIGVLGLGIFLYYRRRLNQIYHDIHRMCAVENGSKNNHLTQEMHLLSKRLSQKPSESIDLLYTTHRLSGLNNERGIVQSFNAKKAGKTGNNLYLALFEIDHHDAMCDSFSDADLKHIYGKIADMISMYEQPLDAIGQLDDDRFLFLMSRGNRHEAFEECEKIVESIRASRFTTSKGIITITVSGGFLLKPPAKSIREGIEDALKLISMAQENGGNKIAQLREKGDSFRE